MRVPFIGVIEGEVSVRDGESEWDAILRAQSAINDALSRNAKRYGRISEGEKGFGPIVGLEPRS